MVLLRIELFRRSFLDVFIGKYMLLFADVLSSGLNILLNIKNGVWTRPTANPLKICVFPFKWRFLRIIHNTEVVKIGNAIIRLITGKFLAITNILFL